MKITVVAVVCHMLSPIPDPVCREEIVAAEDMPMEACIMSQAAIADWKSRSIFRGDQWSIARIKCVPGIYAPRDAI